MTIVEAARTYIGVPWRHLGRSRRGLDCAGLPWIAYKDCGVTLPDRKRYGRDPLEDTLKTALIEAVGDPVWDGPKGTVPRETLQPGCVVVMAPESQARHVAIIGDSQMYGLSLIHADGTLGIKKVWEHGLTDQFMKMIVTVFWRPV